MVIGINDYRLQFFKTRRKQVQSLDGIHHASGRKRISFLLRFIPDICKIRKDFGNRNIQRENILFLRDGFLNGFLPVQDILSVTGGRKKNISAGLVHKPVLFAHGL